MMPPLPPEDEFNSYFDNNNAFTDFLAMVDDDQDSNDTNEADHFANIDFGYEFDDSDEGRNSSEFGEGNENVLYFFDNV